MITLILKRVIKAASGVFGVLIAPDAPFCVTVENKDLHIPAGEYLCKRSFYHAGGYETFEITGVPDRTRILIHKGNLQIHSKGCVILGEQFEPLNGVPAVLSSGAAFMEFMKITKGTDEFKIKIVECY